MKNLPHFKESARASLQLYQELHRWVGDGALHLRTATVAEDGKL